MTEQPYPATRDDPTKLTTEQLRREIAMQRELFEVRLAAIEKATELLAKTKERIFAEMDLHVSHLRTLHEQRFSSIQMQFDERDERFRQAQAATQGAIGTALNAQKEAAAKSEATTLKQVESIDGLIKNVTEALSDKINSINARLDRTEGRDKGLSANVATGIAAVAVLVSLLGATGFLRMGGGGGGNPIPGPAGSVTVPIPAAPR